MVWSDLKLTKYKVALTAKARSVSQHNELRNAERSQGNMGYKYNIYGWDTNNKKWVKIY